jgi:hypothetical protein
VFATPSFVLNMMFSSMLSFSKLYHRKQGLFFVYIGEISKCYISRITQDLEFIFRVPIRRKVKINMYVKFHLVLWLCPFKTRHTFYCYIGRQELETHSLNFNGPNFREPWSFKWQQNFISIMDSVEDYARRSAKSTKEELDSLSEWVKI